MATNFLHGGEYDFVVVPANDTSIEPVTFKAGDPILIGRRFPAIAMTGRADNTVENAVSFVATGKFDNVPVYITANIHPGYRIYFDATPPAAANGYLVTAPSQNVIWGHCWDFRSSTTNVIITASLAAGR